MAAPHSKRNESTSPTPAAQSHASNRKDKKRAHIEARAKEIATTLSAHRDVNYRAQLNTLQRDIAFIQRADVYSSTRLADQYQDLAVEVPVINGHGVISETETSKLPMGICAREFIEEINNAADKRDALNTIAQRNYIDGLREAKLKHDFQEEAGEVEEKLLDDAFKQRLRNSLLAKKKALERERELLQSADTSAMLHGAGISSAAPGSPGGLHSNRKTRHGRHTRQEPENPESQEGAKRKRKPDYEESPGPASRALPTAATTDKASDVANYHEPGLLRWFSRKELAAFWKQAQIIVAQRWVEEKVVQMSNGVPVLTNGHYTSSRGKEGTQDIEDNDVNTNALVAPAMDRTGSHATRSTRNHQPDITSAKDAQEALKNPKRRFGAAMLEALGTKQTKAAKGDAEAPWTPGVSTAEANEDKAFLDSVMS